MHSPLWVTSNKPISHQVSPTTILHLHLCSTVHPPVHPHNQIHLHLYPCLSIHPPHHLCNHTGKSKKQNSNAKNIERRKTFTNSHLRKFEKIVSTIIEQKHRELKLMMVTWNSQSIFISWILLFILPQR